MFWRDDKRSSFVTSLVMHV